MSDGLDFLPGLTEKLNDELLTRLRAAADLAPRIEISDEDAYRLLGMIEDARKERDEQSGHADRYSKHNATLLRDLEEARRISGLNLDVSLKWAKAAKDAESIVRQLAATCPYDFNESVWQCTWCEKWAHGAHNALPCISSTTVLPVQHDGYCLWYQAKKLIEVML